MLHTQVDLRDPNNPVVQAALTRRCPGCKAQPGQHCASVLPKPFPDRRLIHYIRVEKWDLDNTQPAGATATPEAP